MPKVVGQDNTVYKRVTCRNCGSVNEYTPNEVRMLSEGRDYGGGYDRRDGFNCAGCGAEIVTRHI